MSSINPGTIHNAANGDKEAMRTVLNAISSQLSALSLGTGVQILEPTSGATKPTPVTPTPGQATLNVQGANGLYTGSITPPNSTIAAALYFEISYSLSSNFSNATVMPLSPSTSFVISLPGTTYYWRVRCTYDRASFGAYSPTSGGNPPVSSNLQSSAATADAVVLNQTNYATVDSVPNGIGSHNIRVYGSTGPQTNWIGVKGGVETVQPSATIVNTASGTSPFVAFDGEQFLVKTTLPQVFGDSMTPVGQVGVPAGGSVILPAITPVLSGGSVVGFNVTAGGSNIGSPLNIVIAGDGAGATAGAQTISGGVLQSVAPGNGGAGYTHATATPSGGASVGTSGGGTIKGNNGGRLTAIQGNG